MPLNSSLRLRGARLLLRIAGEGVTNCTTRGLRAALPIFKHGYEPSDSPPQ